MKVGMKVIFKSGRSLHTVLTKMKDTLPMEKHFKGHVLDPLQLWQNLHTAVRPIPDSGDAQS